MNRKVRQAQGSTRSVHRETHRLQGRPQCSLKLDIAPLAFEEADGEAVNVVRSQHKGIAILISEILEGLSGLTLKCCMCVEMKRLCHEIQLCIENVGDPADSTSTDLSMSW